MRYLFQSFIGTDKYTYKMQFDHAESATTLENSKQRLTRVMEYFRDASECTCYYYVVFENDIETGEMRVVETGGDKKPLQTRVEINKEAKDKPRAPVMPRRPADIRWDTFEPMPVGNITVTRAGFGLADVNPLVPPPATNTVAPRRRPRATPTINGRQVRETPEQVLSRLSRQAMERQAMQPQELI